ncbi:MAG: Photosystem II lipoprotein Psb27 [Chroococcidiopsis cubana SAG 39.79]|jgi:photosystem II Psb27 protein|uniref:Photosystem II lipoprotein Psb27 n=3 Tax=Chroococcidiopsidaceae TaxID=1890528 RepID=K9TZ64_CHRTP|nr:photosystem II protein Psb27 [Chroococcidiopsis thermalis PCC 7203]MDZ4872454.1 Photosystem II lipoprotein Psb27 [Chroococcidiopsis cubana SAG 39.79]RUT13677.1 photosystem II lipoprotein Psb27 [Chroococcidiopsis cubana SAG 39.79]
MIPFHGRIDCDLSMNVNGLYMKHYWSRLLALVLVVVIGLMGCSSGGGLSGDYRQDTLDVIGVLRNAIELPQDAPNKGEIQAEARKKINDFAARYQRNGSLTGLSSFTTMRTALNSLAGHYSSYPNRPLPAKLKQRLELEFKQVEMAVARGN